MTADYDSGFSEEFYGTPDGLRLYARVYGEQIGGMPVVCLPGLTRNSRDFHQLALQLSTDPERPFKVVSLDYRGRGRSDWDADKSHYNLVTEANDVISACASLAIDRAAFIGTSRGGLTLHVLSGLKPELLAAVILNDIGPVIETEGLRQIQAYLGRERHPRDFDDAAALLMQIHGASFTALEDQDWRDMAHAIYRERDGKILADFDPAIAEQIRAVDLSVPAPDLWEQFDGFSAIALMTIRGENSALLSEGTLNEMGMRHPGMHALTASGQGHAPILHSGEIPAAIHAFLNDNAR
ncbi:MAG TPA: alpha/beta hydrolase [Rhizobium sp.]|nr:alpha/beta hydrolase [Rhizobium sp.]